MNMNMYQDLHGFRESNLYLQDRLKRGNIPINRKGQLRKSGARRRSTRGRLQTAYTLASLPILRETAQIKHEEGKTSK